MKPVLLVLSIITAAPAFGQVYKCPGPNGQFYYQQLPCPEGVPMPIQDNSISNSQNGDPEAGLRPGEREALEASRQQEEAKRQVADPAAQPADPAAQPADSAAQPAKPASSGSGGSSANGGSGNTVNEFTSPLQMHHRLGGSR
ncbi:MAG: hypothetical protein P9D89_07895 [Candidatus Contendobacter sp.]|nr:hypothetical protein [Candidatus Contendobacter sp.]